MQTVCLYVCSCGVLHVNNVFLCFDQLVSQVNSSSDSVTEASPSQLHLPFHIIVCFFVFFLSLISNALYGLYVNIYPSLCFPGSVVSIEFAHSYFLQPMGCCVASQTVLGFLFCVCVGLFFAYCYSDVHRKPPLHILAEHQFTWTPAAFLFLLVRGQLFFKDHL